MWELDSKESRVLKNWCFWIVLLKMLVNPLDCKEIQPVHPKGNQSWIFIARTDAEAETPMLWPPDAKNWLIWKDPNPGKDWKWEENGMTGWDGWMASPTQWTWVGVNSGIWWRTGRPIVLQSMGSQRVRRDWANEMNWLDWCHCPSKSTIFPFLLSNFQVDMNGNRKKKKKKKYIYIYIYINSACPCLKFTCSKLP